MTYYDDTSGNSIDPGFSVDLRGRPLVPSDPSMGYGRPDDGDPTGDGGLLGGFDPRTLAGHAQASQAISDVLMPTIASALNADPSSLTKDRLYDYGADALRRILVGGSLNDMQRGLLAKSAIDFFAGIPDDADGPTIQSRLGGLAAKHITTHGALQQLAAGQGQAQQGGDGSAGVETMNGQEGGGGDDGAGAGAGNGGGPSGPGTALMTSNSPRGGRLGVDRSRFQQALTDPSIGQGAVIDNRLWSNTGMAPTLASDTSGKAKAKGKSEGDPADAMLQQSQQNAMAMSVPKLDDVLGVLGPFGELAEGLRKSDVPSQVAALPAGPGAPAGASHIVRDNEGRTIGYIGSVNDGGYTAFDPKGRVLAKQGPVNEDSFGWNRSEYVKGWRAQRGAQENVEPVAGPALKAAMSPMGLAEGATHFIASKLSDLVPGFFKGGAIKGLSYDETRRFEDAALEVRYPQIVARERAASTPRLRPASPRSRPLPNGQI